MHVLLTGSVNHEGSTSLKQPMGIYSTVNKYFLNAKHYRHVKNINKVNVPSLVVAYTVAEGDNYLCIISKLHSVLESKCCRKKEQ